MLFSSPAAAPTSLFMLHLSLSLPLSRSIPFYPLPASPSVLPCHLFLLLLPSYYHYLDLALTPLSCTYSIRASAFSHFASYFPIPLFYFPSSHTYDFHSHFSPQAIPLPPISHFHWSRFPFPDTPMPFSGFIPRLLLGQQSPRSGQWTGTRAPFPS